MKLLKVLNGRNSMHGGEARWKLKRWMPAVEPIPCKSGYHLSRPKDLLGWLGPDIYIAEGRGKMIECEYKIVFEQARIIHRLDTWNDRSARLFACWCARQVWHLLTDERSRNAVVVAEKYANGEVTKEELAAARDAAWDAARAARDARDARDAAWDAARVAWDAARAAMDAAMDAAWDAARAARDAAWDARAAAWDAQTKKLMEILGLMEE